MGGPAIIDGKTVHAVDNFLPSDFVIDGVTYYSAENYFQCAKCADPTEREKVRKSGTGCDVWSAGSRVQMRSDWEKIKVRAMYTGNKAKFEQNPKLAKDLTSTKGEVIFTGSTNFWCYWNGKIMELLREELKAPEERNEEVIKKIWGLIEDYEKSQ